MGLIDLRIYGRETRGKNANRRARAGGRIPGVLYGSGRETMAVEVDGVDFHKALSTLGGRSVIFSLIQEPSSEDSIALLREVQRHPVTDTILHVDLFEIPRGVPIDVPVQVEITGESAAIKRGDATLTLVLDSVEVNCLPRDLPDSVTIDITGLDVGNRIYVKDLQIDSGRITNDPDELVLLLKAPVIFVEEEEEEEAAEAAAEGEEDAEGEEKKESTKEGAGKREGGDKGGDKADK